MTKVRNNKLSANNLFVLVLFVLGRYSQRAATSIMIDQEITSLSGPLLKRKHYETCI